MYEIEISNSQDVLPLDELLLREVAERTLADEQVAAAEISVAVVDNATIYRLNREFLGHDYETDVLSFLLDEQPPDELPDHTPQIPQSQSRRGVGKRLEGEVILSAEMAAQRAGEFAWTPRDEALLYLVHGLLHLVGYDDTTDAERRLMRKREREILAFWNLSPSATLDGNRGVPDRSSSVRRAPGAES